jgi:hypothetical protein
MVLVVAVHGDGERAWHVYVARELQPEGRLGPDRQRDRPLLASGPHQVERVLDDAVVGGSQRLGDWRAARI